MKRPAAGVAFLSSDLSLTEMQPARCCCGSSSAADVQFVSASEVGWRCGSTVALLNLQSGQQRLLGSSTWRGVQRFCCSLKAGVLAVAAKDYQPSIHIYSSHDLQHQASIAAGATFGYTAIALSHDGELLATCTDQPELELSVWQWRKGLRLAVAQLQAPVTHIDFHPANDAYLLTTSAGLGASEASECTSVSTQQGAPRGASSCDGRGAVHLWQLHKLWDRHQLQDTRMQLPPPRKPTCQKWAPEGVYIGCSDGSVVCISPETGLVVGTTAAAGGARQPEGSAGGLGSVAAASSSAADTASVSGIAVNKHLVTVACSSSPHLSFFARCSSSSSSGSSASTLQDAPAMKLLGQVQVSTVGCAAVAFGGPALASLAVSTLDGSLLLLSPGQQFSASQPDPAALQVEPLADWHVGAIAGIAAAATSGHLISCGADGSIRGWAAAAGGQLISKRDVGGQLTCCAGGLGTQRSLLAVGSAAGVLRLVDTGDLSSLPVVHHSRLLDAPVTHVAASPCGTYLAAAAASTGRVGLLKLDAAQHVQLLGFVQPCEGAVTGLCWLAASGPSQQPRLLVASADSKVMLLTPPAQPCARSSGSSSAAQHTGPLELGPADVHAVRLQAPAPLHALAAVSQGSASTARSSSSSGSGMHAAGNDMQVLGAGCDGNLYWLEVPAASSSSGSHVQQLRVAAKVPLPWVAAAMAVSPTGRDVLVASEHGAVMLLPSAAADAISFAAASHEGPAACGPPAELLKGSAAHAALAWGPGGAWAASAGADGSLLVYPGSGDPGEAAFVSAAAPSTAAAAQDCDVVDDLSAPTVAEAAAAAAEEEARAAAAAVRAAAAQRLQDLKRRLDEVLEANAAAPSDQQLSEVEVVVNTQLLQQQRAAVAAEEAQLLSEAPRKSGEQEVQAKRLKALCWDAYQVKRAVCTGLKSGNPCVWNFHMPASDESSWAQVAEQRREQLLEAGKQVADNPARSAASSIIDKPLATAAVDAPTGINRAQDMQDLLAKLARVKACADARDCKPADLLLPELAVVSPEAKLMQVELYKRMIWELKTQFNEEFDRLVQQKHTDADRLTDINTRADELVRELVNIHMVLNPVAAASAPAASTGSDPEAAVTSDAPAGQVDASNASSAARTAVGSSASGGAASAEQLVSDLAAGQIVPYWSPEEDLEGLLLKVSSGEVKAAKYLTSEERARADAEAAAAEAQRRAAAADSSRARALQQMMGGRLHRSVDEVSELVTSRPAWMSGDPSTFSEEQLREYKQYTAKEAAAIEERLKRKGIMETELRTLRAAAEEVASKFDVAVAGLATKRLSVLAEATALETRVLQLLADEEVATVTAGLEAQQAAAQQLQEAQTALEAVQQEVAATEQLHAQQQEALAALHAEEKAADRAFKREFGHLDSPVVLQLNTLYKARTRPLDSQHSAGAAAGAAARAGRVGSARRGSPSGIGPSPRPHGVHATSPHASKVGNQLGITPPAGLDVTGPTGHSPSSHTDAASAELVFGPLQLASKATGSSQAPAATSAAAAGAHGHAQSASGSSAAHQELCGPLGPPELQVVQLSDAQAPEGLEEELWARFVELHAARAHLDLAVREQTAKVLCLKRQLQLQLDKQAALSDAVATAAAGLQSLQQRQQQALHDVEVQLRLKLGQVEVWPTDLSSIAPEALLVGRQEVKGLNSIILSKGDAKLDMLRNMKEFKRGIHRLEWENKKCEMEAEDVISLTQQLQLLHVTKEFQQQVKDNSLAAGRTSSAGGTRPPGAPGSSASGGTAAPSGRAATAPAAATPPAAKSAGAGAGSANSTAANKEVANLENLLKMREALHASAVEQKRRQLKSLEGQVASKRSENATLALHLAGLERMLDEAARLRATTADDGSSAADHKARMLAMQAKLRDIADAQAAEIAVAEQELQTWQRRCFPFLPALPGDDEQPSGGADQAPSSSSKGSGGGGSCNLPHIKGAQGSPARQPAGAGALAGSIPLEAGGFAPHGARDAAAALTRVQDMAQGGGGAPRLGKGSPRLFAVERVPRKTWVGPDAKPGLGSKR